MNKLMAKLLVAAGLLVLAPVSMACPGKCADKDACPTHNKRGSLFMEMDQNKDGTVSRKEFDTFHGNHFKEIDTNKDGKLSEEEMQAMHKGWREQGRATFQHRFDESDADHDGGLTKEEAKDMPMLYENFDEADINKDGKVSKEEIRALVQKHREEHGGMMPMQK